LLFNQNLETELLVGNGRAYGLEFQVQKKKGKLTGWLSYTLSKSERKIDGINNGSYYVSNFDKTHDLSLTAIYELNKRSTLSSNFVFASGQPATYPSGRYEHSNLVIANYNLRNQDRLPNFHRLDVSYTLKSKPSKKRDSRWIFSLYNVYNRKNAASITFREQNTNAAGAEASTGISEAVRLSYFGIIPGVTYELKF